MNIVFADDDLKKVCEASISRTIMTESLFVKNWASPPGDTIQDALEELGMNQRDLAARLGVTPKHVNDLIKGRANITADIAVRL